jgi:hypothetical protein
MWDSFMEMAVEYLRCQPDRLKAEFQLGIWPRYDYDQEAGTLTFSSDGKVFENVKHCSADVRAYGERRISGSRWQRCTVHGPSERSKAWPNGPPHKPLERPDMSALRPTDGTSAGRSAPSR